MKTVKNFPNYAVTQNGQVWSKSQYKPLKSKLSHKDKLRGRLTVNLYHHNKCQTHYVHRLVIETFIGPCPAGMLCSHLDGNPVNNRLDNLKWRTKEEIEADKLPRGTSNCGEGCGHAKLTASDVKDIRMYYKSGGILQKQLGLLFNVSTSNISYIINRHTWQYI